MSKLLEINGHEMLPRVEGDYICARCGEIYLLDLELWEVPRCEAPDRTKVEIILNRKKPPPAARVSSARVDAFWAKMQHQGVANGDVEKVLDGLEALAVDLYGGSRWYQRGRKAVGVIVGIVRLLKAF